MELTVVILAAGVGRRFGGLKQIEAVGPGGATIMDYSIYDVLRAGFRRVVFIIRPDMEDAFRSAIGGCVEQRMAVAYAFQRLENVPAGFSVPTGRTKPWGTGQALLAAAELVDGPFAVINADDFYGASSYVALADFMGEKQNGGCGASAPFAVAPNRAIATYALVSYALRDTLAEGGTVSRAICRADADGWLETIVETVGIERNGADARYVDERGMTHALPGSQRVSMNMWGFTPAIFAELRDGFARFLKENAASTSAEFYLPTAVQDALRAGRARVKLLPSQDAWCGMTHPQDKARTMEIIAGLIAKGAYPERLW